jgi:hypothetical protein
MHPPPIPPSQDRAGLPNADEEHLRQLSIGHYIYAGFELFFVVLFGGMFIGFGASLTLHPEWFQGPNPPPPFMGAIFTAIGAIVAIFALGSAICTILAGRYIRQRKHHTFCLVIAALHCLSMPLGTILGVFTIIVLIRPQVKLMFGVA